MTTGTAKPAKPTRTKTTTVAAAAAGVDLPSLARIAGGVLCAYGSDTKGASRAAAAVYRELKAAYQGKRFEAAVRIAAGAAPVVGGDAAAIVEFVASMLAAVEEAAG